MFPGSQGQRQMQDKHHRALPILFFTEMWERFSYYGMRGLLIFYLTKHLLMSDAAAGKIYGAYTALVYLAPLLGGYAADNILGRIKSVYIGGILMMIGHFSLALEGIFFFYAGLAFLIFGNGFFKPNMSSLLGELYTEKQTLRESAYTIFYMGINIGGAFGPLLCGYIGEKYGWHYGFSLAGFGMFIGLVQFYFGRGLIGNVGEFKPSAVSEHRDVPLSRSEKNSLVYLAVLGFFALFFWIPYEQMGSAVSLFTDRKTDRFVFGTEIPASMFQSVNGFMILMFAPITAGIWTALSKEKKDLAISSKFILAVILLGLSYLVLYFGEIFTGNAKTPLIYLMLYYALLTFGELCISPVGLSMAVRLAPVKFSVTVVGFWFTANAVSHYVSGWLSGAYFKWFSVHDFFLFLALVCFGSAVILSVFSRKLEELLNE